MLLRQVPKLEDKHVASSSLVYTTYIFEEASFLEHLRSCFHQRQPVANLSRMFPACTSSADWLCASPVLGLVSLECADVPIAIYVLC